jgi:transcriptional regulator with XRE-family HTH domain
VVVTSRYTPADVPKLARLREHRERRFFSLQDLADKAGVTKQAVLRLEQGKTSAQPRTVRKLAEALAVEPAELL